MSKECFTLPQRDGCRDAAEQGTCHKYHCANKRFDICEERFERGDEDAE